MGEATYQLVQDFSHQQYHHILSHIWYHINFNNSPNHGPKKLHKSYTCFVLFFITQIHLYLFVNIYIYIYLYMDLIILINICLFPKTRLMAFLWLTMPSPFFSESGYFSLVIFQKEGMPTSFRDTQAKRNKNLLQLVQLRDVKPSTIKPQQKPVEVGPRGFHFLHHGGPLNGRSEM